MTESFSTRLRIARRIISALPFTQTGSAAPVRATLAVLPQRQRCHGLNDIAANRGQIGLLRLRNDRNIKLGDLQELIDDSAHEVDVIMQFMKQRGIRQRFETRPKDGKRSTQFMGRVGGKFPLYPEAASSRSSAWFTASTSGRISLGILSVGMRISVRIGPMFWASCEAWISGRTARRKMMISAVKSSSRMGSVIQPTRRKKLATMSSSAHRGAKDPRRPEPRPDGGQPFRER